MKQQNIINLFSKNDIKLLQEDLQNKSKSINIENNNFQNKVYLLKNEVNKKWKELVLYYQNEYRKIVFNHNQKLNTIQIQ